MRYTIGSILIWSLAVINPVWGKNNGKWDNLPQSVKDWFHRQKIQACCSEADGDTTDFEIKSDGYYVPVPWNPQGEEYWEHVPDSAIIYSEGNPIGQALIWFNIGGRSIRCFIPCGGV